MGKTTHLGQNIRYIRILRGMKQATFAKEFGIAQQNVSKMENRKAISDEQLEKAAKILDTTAEAIKDFDQTTVINNNNFHHDQTNNIFPVKDLIAYFKDELLKKDEEIESLKAALEQKQPKQDEKPDSPTLKALRSQ
ncbi:helix-turn-helix domain-containing protein [Pedobacter caeni]|uniref:Helix-turn-helix n=1 Tax=Pedobacter caeni TaxID=288992 RepID=A0A1M5JNV6_9SPHI|nr:helix-turn-helix transcriptional regulator [Pedobacter caeni]SHG42257.1 Helix-turn-helix [Pedobacter caeni]